MSSTVARASLFVTMITIYFLFLMSMFSYFEMASSIEMVVPPLSNIRKASLPSVTIPNIPKAMHSPIVGVYYTPSFIGYKAQDGYPLPIISDDNETSPLGIIPAHSVISPEPVVMRNGDMLRTVANWAWAVLTRGRRELLRTRHTPRRVANMHLRVQAKE